MAERVLGHRRLVTIIGPGGIGKTALALAAMERLGGEFPLGAHFVDLSRVGEADAVVGALAAQLGFSSFDALLSSPTDQPALVVVDNCEHVGDAAAAAVAALLAECASPRILATSRSPLDLPGESILALAPLGLPGAGTGDASATAVRLFLDRARHAGTAVQGLDDEEVGELCRRLDGVPLALEIAAARTRSLAVGDILRLLDDGIDVLARPRFRARLASAACGPPSSGPATCCPSGPGWPSSASGCAPARPPSAWPRPSCPAGRSRAMSSTR